MNSGALGIFTNNSEKMDTTCMTTLAGAAITKGICFSNAGGSGRYLSCTSGNLSNAGIGFDPIPKGAQC